MKDDHVIVLDFLRHGHTYAARAVPTAQVIGEKHFSLLEVTVRDGVEVKPHERLYIGAEERDKIQSVKRRLTVEELTATARSELEDAVEKLVEQNEADFVNFFNRSGPITTRLHQLEVLPGIGKKHMWQIIDERKRNPFETFDDIKKRVTLLPNPRKAVVKRILEELEGKSKWYIFTTPPKRKF